MTFNEYCLIMNIKYLNAHECNYKIILLQQSNNFKNLFVLRNTVNH